MTVSIKERLASLVAEAARSIAGPAFDVGTLPIGRPKDASHGDAAIPCFPLAKAAGQAPPAVAKAFAERLVELAKENHGILTTAEAVGPFVNVRYERAALAEDVVRGVLERREPFGPWKPNDTRVVIDYSSPNIAKPFHFGHLRSTVIGAALRRIYKHTGHTVFGINHLGDWGSQFGKILIAFEEWGDQEALHRDPMRHLYEIYVRFKRESDADPRLNERAAEAFRRLESGEDNAERRRWQELRDISLEAFQGPYRRLAAEFEAITGESFYEDKIESTLAQLKDAGITTVSEGALVVEIDGMPPCILVKSDGTTIYATRDLAALYYRRATYEFDKALYVVGAEQKLHFRQLKEVIAKLGWKEADGIEHIDFGLVLTFDPEQKRWTKFSTRGGNAIFLDEVLDEAVAKARTIIDEKNPDLADKDAVAEAIGVGAIVFNDLKNTRIKDVKFDWDELLSFEGETGPYVQYAGARLSSILRKAGSDDAADAIPADIVWCALHDAERVLITMLDFGSVLERCVDKNEPYILTSFVTSLASEIHSYLREHHVLSAEPEVKAARLLLVRAARDLIREGLALLGVASPEEM
ncbi:MAG: arginine--tRNA ligase [Planctomycetes bacterium]|nr:arginine--tRNA ligase [Planctomycetota bacterium]MCB9917598.1 arginine--tRNA ligase [Planctomycetota bacterium]